MMHKRGRKEFMRHHTTMPRLTFSPPFFSSTASSRTMFIKTCPETIRRSGTQEKYVARDAKEGKKTKTTAKEKTYVVAAEDANNFPVAVELNEQPLLHILEI
jgi:hypothetical protein